jgi:hypothetical protein
MTGYVRHKAVHAAGMKSPIARRAVAAVVVYAAGYPQAGSHRR